MSAVPSTAPAPAPAALPPGPQIVRRPARRVLRRIAIQLLVCCAIAAGAWYAWRAYQKVASGTQPVIPTARVLKGDVSLTVTARAELRGGNSESLTAPMTGGNEMHITYLRTPGEPVKTGDIVVQLDTTEQDYKLREAQSDLAEAQQKVMQAKAQQQAEAEEDRYALLKAQADIQTAELDVKKNPILAAIIARENDLALAAARDKLAQLQHNIVNRKATSAASIATQEAAAGKAETEGKTAQRNIDAMTLRAHRTGYVSIRENSNQNMMYFGMTLPLFQPGDAVRAGMVIAEIPDLNNWDVNANISELDRGHIATGDKVAIRVVALPNHPFTGHVKNIGGTGGPPWDRKFQCKIALDDPLPELRPGMSATVVVATDQLRGVLSLPAQALFEENGRTFVYARSPAGFTPRDVKLVRRSETRVVVTGVQEGSEVALANPTDLAKKKSAEGSAMKSLQK